MNKPTIVSLIFGGSILWTACSVDKLDLAQTDIELMQAVRSASPTFSTDYWILPDGSDLSQIPQDPLNPLTEEKIKLGQFLFFEPGLGNDALTEESMRTFSCSTCHVPESGFKPGRSQGIGDGAMGHGVRGEARFKRSDYNEDDIDAQVLRPLSMVNAAFSAEVTQWNGQHGAVGQNAGTEDRWAGNPELVGNYMGLHGIESQNIQGLITHRQFTNEDIVTELGYKEMYDEAFADVPVEERYNNFQTSLALSAYLRSIIADKAPFQEWLKGDTKAMTEAQKRGAQIFFTKGNCTNCHNSPAFNAPRFFALGVNDLRDIASFKENDPATDFRNLGRGGFTGNPDENYAFKVPTLYNLKGSEFFFHGSSKRSIREVVEYKNLAQKENPRVPEEAISSLFLPLNLTEQEMADLTEFLDNALFDANIMEHVPTELPSGNCFPNNDYIARREICGQ